ncbi:MAG TPA: DUF3887 domain-containing protein [Gammaproteobacteria bacterium]|nr:DUF3887 domain-containing protein [Gammaproteobacteria bacterium]
MLILLASMPAVIAAAPSDTSHRFPVALKTITGILHDTWDLQSSLIHLMLNIFDQKTRRYMMRIRFNIASILLCSSLLLGTSLVFAANDKPAQNREVQQVQTLVTQLSKGNFAAVETEFNDKMKQELPTARLKAVWTQITEQTGAFQKTGETRTLNYQDDSIVLVKTVFKDGELWTQVAFDKTGKIAGLYFKPAS